MIIGGFRAPFASSSCPYERLEEEKQQKCRETESDDKTRRRSTTLLIDKPRLIRSNPNPMGAYGSLIVYGECTTVVQHYCFQVPVPVKNWSEVQGQV